MVGRWYIFVIGLYAGCLWGQSSGADFLTADISIHPEPRTSSLTGEVYYRFESSGSADSLYLDAQNMDFQEVLLDGNPVNFAYNGKRLSVPALRLTGGHELFIRYRCRPVQTLYFIGWEDAINGNEQIWTQGQGKYSSHWVPSFDDMREKVIFNMQVQFEKPYTVVANGILDSITEEAGRKTWSFHMRKPMSSYLLAFAIGDFNSDECLSGSGIPLKLFYPEGRGAEANNTYRHTAELFDYLEKEIGIPYPWQVYKQVPVEDFLYAGMENTTATFFASDYLVDSLGHLDRSYVNINAHELAHQWFGNLVTEVDGRSHWLHEGFASYYAQLAERELFGAEEAYWKLYRSAQQLIALDNQNNGSALLDPESSSLIFYEKGAWALWALRDEIGSASFREGIRQYLTSFAYSNASVQDFLRIMERIAGRSLERFRADWLESTTFPRDWALDFLASNSPSLSYYLEFSTKPYTIGTFAKAWEAFDIPHYRAALITHSGLNLTRPDLERAFSESHPLVLKALLSQIGPLEDWMEPYVDRLLEGPGYEIREAALYQLWVSFPDRRNTYLERTYSNGSMASKRFSQLWWMLAVFTPDYATPQQRKTFLEELQATTSRGNPREVRRNGFNLLQQIDGLTPVNIRDLADASEHHSWQFRIFARRLLDQLIETRPDSDFWQQIGQSFSKETHPYFFKKIEEL